MVQITPFLTQNKAPSDLQDKIVELIRADAALSTAVPESLRQSLTYLLRMVNSYYSNKIEGNPTLPAAVLRAQELSADKSDSKDIAEILRNAEVQTKLALGNIDPDYVCTRPFLEDMHRRFFEGLPDGFLEVRNPDTGETMQLVPGVIRETGVRVGEHIPPLAQELAGYLEWFAQVYQPKRLYGLNRVLAAAAAHHRLMYIHPFLDGNGRVGRLFGDCYMRCAGFPGCGFWSMSRGFGRNTAAYYAALNRADMSRQGDFDGRGILSDAGLLDFTSYFVDVALDQVNYFTGLLDLKPLLQRIDVYFATRVKGGYITSSGEALGPLDERCVDVYKKLLADGPQPRSALAKITGGGENTLRAILRVMTAEGLIQMPKKGEVAIALSSASIPVLFPNLW